MFWVAYIIFTTLIFILPIYFLYDNGLSFTYGDSVNIVYISTLLYTFISIVFLIWNIDNIKDKRFLPLFIFIVLGGACSYIQYKNPGLLLSVPLHAFVTFLMYFTIENPDMTLIEELISSKEITEQANENKTMFIYNIVNKIRLPLNYIKDIITATSTEKDKKVISNNLKEVETEINSINLIINDILDISNISNEKIKVFDTYYDISLIVKEIELKYKNKVNDNIDFRINISKGIPKKLYGDNLRIKQVTYSLLNNSFKYTKKGYIELGVSSIIKDNICRLIITIEDTGIGFDTNKISKTTEFELSDELDVSIPLIKKILSFLGGTILIESEKEKGTKVIVVIDQRIKKDNLNFIYNKIIINRKNMLYIDKNYLKKKKSLSKLLRDTNIIMEYNEYGVYAIKKIRNNESYDLIILNDNIERTLIEDVLDKINIEQYKGKIIVIGDIVKENIYKEKNIYMFIPNTKTDEEIIEIIKNI